MMRRLVSLATFGALFLCGCSDSDTKDSGQGATAPPPKASTSGTSSDASSGTSAKPIVVIETSMGPITLELDAEKAPITVANFLKYVDDGFYDGTIFHRVISGFMIQGGGLTPGMEKKPTRDPIKNEATNGLKNARATIAMARTGDPHSATAQFFINVVDNGGLDHPGRTGWGYCVFGKVVSGMDVVDKIRAVATTTKAGRANVPVEDVMIKSAKRKK